jgi:hypothetical protein
LIFLPIFMAMVFGNSFESFRAGQMTGRRSTSLDAVRWRWTQAVDHLEPITPD